LPEIYPDWKEIAGKKIFQAVAKIGDGYGGQVFQTRASKWSGTMASIII